MLICMRRKEPATRVFWRPALRRGQGLQVDVFEEMVSLRALHLDEVTWSCLDTEQFGTLMKRLEPLTNLEEMSLSAAGDRPPWTVGDLCAYSELCSFWRDICGSMAQVLRSLRIVHFASQEQQTSFTLR